MALVFFVIAFSTSSTEILKFSGSQSTNTGFKPKSPITSVVAM